MVIVDPYIGDVQRLRQVFGAFPSGVAALAAVVGGEPTVLVASSFAVGISQDPPLALFAVQRSSTTWPALAQASTIGVSILSESHGVTCRQLASKDKSTRFDGTERIDSDSGAILIADAAVWMECAIEHEYPAGDHDIIVLRVLGMEHHEARPPLVFHGSRFRRLV